MKEIRSFKYESFFGAIFTLFSYFSLQGGPVAGIANWSRPLKQAYGEAVTLYDHIPGSSDHHGDPIADIYAVIARPNNAVLAMAEGCNWGPKSQQAACCAVRGCVGKLNELLFSDPMPENVRQVTACIQQSFSAARELLVKHASTNSSLCAAVVCPIGRKKWGLCVVSIGDVACYVWRNKKGMVYEATFAARHGLEDVSHHRGYLGSPWGEQTDMNDCTCCYVPVADDDVVFLTSKGISDNFDPVVLLEGTTEINQKIIESSKVANDQSRAHVLPLLTSAEREDIKLVALSELLRACRARRKSNHLSALALKEALIEHVVEVTEEKRNFLEKSWQDMNKMGLKSDAERSEMEKEMFKLAETYPGKLEHAGVVAYQVGTLDNCARYTRTNLFLYSPTMTDLGADSEVEDSS